MTMAGGRGWMPWLRQREVPMASIASNGPDANPARRLPAAELSEIRP
ncbi:MAG: hypothetical protein J2P35_01915 [Actinobacteria bacterium]|nr:hypothetical protein [Actinomycetota bacterium]MBO0786386.1 hypothetical protein [Actinomycetota bacterium]MBO0816117.1 hypothetical protein [Actinomycetota bacterium]